MNTTQWFERLCAIETDGSKVDRVQLLTDEGEVYDTWFAPFDVTDAVTSLDARLRDVEQEFSAGTVCLMLVAETQSVNGRRETLSRMPIRVQGQAKKSHRESALTATTVAFDTLATTIEKLQRLTNTQLDAARRNTELQNESIFQLTELVKVYREREAEGPSTEPTVVEQLLQTEGPQMLALLSQLLLDSASKKKTTNGAAPKEPTDPN